MSKNDHDKVLVVDDEAIIRNMLKSTLTKNNYEVELAKSGTEALNRLNEKSYDLMVTDVYLPDKNGLEILKTAKKVDPGLGVIVITGQSSIEDAVEAIKEGAHDYLRKGFSLDEFMLTVQKYFKYHNLVKENERLKIKLEDRVDRKNFIGNHSKIKRIFEIVETVAPTNATVLIEGASGTGKELVAKAIHQYSTRRGKPFIKTNCAAIPEGLIESELFGHEKGAFTGAIRTTKGRFELAHTGTILLDEIGEISSTLQAKLLRVLQEKVIEKVGNPVPVKIDVRIIATTNRDLKKEVKQGNFREDLYYRLNVVPLKLPTLKERKEDIPLLVEHFVDKHCLKNNLPVPEISDKVMKSFLQYNWPGNVRELENIIERAVVLCRGEEIQQKHIYYENENNELPPQPLPLGMTLEELEQQYILQVLEEHDGNRTHTAKALDISIRTLRNKLRSYKEEGIEVRPSD